MRNHIDLPFARSFKIWAHSFSVLPTCMLVLCLVGCASSRPSLLTKKETATFYDLTRVTVPSDDLPTVSEPLAVTQPHAIGILGTSYIMVQVDNHELRPLGNARWAGRMPRRLQVLLIDALEGTRRLPLVERDPSLISGGYHLRSELREMRVVVSNGQGVTIRVRVAARLHRVPSRHLVAATMFEEQATAVSGDAAAIVAALDHALGAAVRDAVVWTVRAAADDEAASVRAEQ